MAVLRPERSDPEDARTDSGGETLSPGRSRASALGEPVWRDDRSGTRDDVVLTVVPGPDVGPVAADGAAPPVSEAGAPPGRQDGAPEGWPASDGSTGDDATGAPRPEASGHAEVGSAPLFRGMIDQDPTEDIRTTPSNDRPGWHVRLFGSTDFFRLWLVQVVSATGDWLGLTATIAFANQLYAGQGGSAAAISAVISVRLIPGFLFGPVVGVFVDRWDRKKTMIIADVSRAGILLVLPFAKNLGALIVASLALEVFALMWTPSKDSIVPHLVPREHLTTANSLSMAAAFGTAPFAQLIFAALAGVSALIATVSSVSFLGLNQTALAFFFDAATFLFSALMIWRLSFPRRARHADADASREIHWTQTIEDLKEGWQYVFINPTVRAVNLGLGVALIGGGMLIPLGAVFASSVLGAGAAGYGLFTTALMFGVAGGVITVSALQRRLDKSRAFVVGLFVAGVALFCAASVTHLSASVVFVFIMGAATGPVYVLGFAILQAEVDEQLRGRVFGALVTLIRFCVLAGLVLGPLVATVLGGVSSSVFGGEISVGSTSIAIPGVRLTLWLDALIIVGAGLIARHALRTSDRLRSTSIVAHPANPAARAGARGPSDQPDDAP